jgi:hypothetical protein
VSHFLRPRGAASQLQIRHVHACDQQHDHDCGREQIQGWTNRAEDDVGQQFDVRATTPVDGKFAFEIGRNRCGLGLRSRTRRAGREAAQHEDRVGFPRKRLWIGL